MFPPQSRRGRKETNKMIPEIEKASKEEIKVFQEEKLKETLRYLSEKSPFY